MLHSKLFWFTLLLNEQAQLWSSNWTYEESLRLLDETNAAVEMHKHGGCSLDLSGVDLNLVSALSLISPFYHCEIIWNLRRWEGKNVFFLVQNVEVICILSLTSLMANKEFDREISTVKRCTDLLVGASLSFLTKGSEEDKDTITEYSSEEFNSCSPTSVMKCPRGKTIELPSIS